MKISEEHRKKLREGMRKYWENKPKREYDKDWRWRETIKCICTNIKIRAIIRGSTKYKKLRLEVLKRDSYKCIVCGNNQRLQVHHKDKSLLLRVLDFLRIYNGVCSYNDIYNYEDFWNIDLLETKCFKCHMKTVHCKKFYGYKLMRELEKLRQKDVEQGIEVKRLSSIE